MNSSSRRRLLLCQGAVILVIGLCATTAVIALRSTAGQVDDARQIDERLVVLDRLYGDVRELGSSARRYILTGDRKETLRVQAIVAATYPLRSVVGRHSRLPSGEALEVALDEYIAKLLNALEIDETDPTMRLSHFEEELARIRAPVSMAFDDALSRSRARRHALRAADPLTTAAQWMIFVSALLGIGLAITTLTIFTRQPAPTDLAAMAHSAPAAAPPAAPSETPSVLR